MMTSKLPARNGSPLAAAATTPVRARSPSPAARLAATRNPSRGRSVRTTRPAGPSGQVQPGPAPPRPQIEQAVGGRQVKFAGEGVGLVHGGEAVGAPVAADDPLLDLAGEGGRCVAVALLEQGQRLGLIPAAHGHLDSRSWWWAAITVHARTGRLAARAGYTQLQWTSAWPQPAHRSVQ